MSWSGRQVAKGTPQAVVDKLQAAIARAMQSAAVRCIQLAHALGRLHHPSAGLQTAQRLRQQRDRRLHAGHQVGLDQTPLAGLQRQDSRLRFSAHCMLETM
ncbi:MAG: hypothetical protein LH479_09140 [Polaromonas sp.]|nr:hypothetical protein [Polaromonas sp.]